MTVMDRAEVGALYKVTYLLNRGAGDFRYVATMLYLGNEQWSLRPIAGTQTLPDDRIESIDLAMTKEQVVKIGGSRAPNLPVKRMVSLGRVRRND